MIVIYIIIALGMVGGFICGVPWFIWFVIHEHRAANSYRHLVKLAQAMPKKSAEPGYTVTYRDGGKTKTMDVKGTTEAEVMKELIRTKAVAYDKIVSCVRR